MFLEIEKRHGSFHFKNRGLCLSPLPDPPPCGSDPGCKPGYFLLRYQFPIDLNPFFVGKQCRGNVPSNRVPRFLQNRTQIGHNRAFPVRSCYVNKFERILRISQFLQKCFNAFQPQKVSLRGYLSEIFPCFIVIHIIFCLRLFLTQQLFFYFCKESLPYTRKIRSCRIKCDSSGESVSALCTSYLHEASFCNHLNQHS